MVTTNYISTLYIVTGSCNDWEIKFMVNCKVKHKKFLKKGKNVA